MIFEVLFRVINVFNKSVNSGSTYVQSLGEVKSPVEVSIEYS